MSAHFVVMCDDGTTTEDAGDRTGTVVAVYQTEDGADTAMADFNAQAHVQRRTYEEWARISYEENPVRKPERAGIAGMGAQIVERNKRRHEWIKTHPMPPTNLMHRFWIARIDGPEAT